MQNVSRALGAALIVGLAVPQAAADIVNDETDARAFIVREAEIKQAQSEEAAPQAGAGEAASTPAQAEAEKPQPRASTPVPPALGRSANAAPESLRALVARHAAANGVPFALADAVVRVESRYNPRAANRGNYGLMQIRHQTARGIGYSGSAAGLLDAETNARYGMKYLAQAYRLAGGDTCRTIMKYQGGHGAVRMSGANRAYCAKVRTFSASN